MVDFKTIPKNKKAILIAAAVVLVALIVLLFVLFIPKGGEEAGESSASTGEGGQIVVNPAGLDDNQSVAGLDDSEETEPSRDLLLRRAPRPASTPIIPGRLPPT